MPPHGRLARRDSTCGDVPPAEFEADYYDATRATGMQMTEHLRNPARFRPFHNWLSTFSASGLQRRLALTTTRLAARPQMAQPPTTPAPRSAPASALHAQRRKPFGPTPPQRFAPLQVQRCVPQEHPQILSPDSRSTRSRAIRAQPPLNPEVIALPTCPVSDRL
jgi:hypothetical protein